MAVITYSTMLLDTVSWDLCLDIFSNIAVAQPPYAVAQDAASAARLFLGELYYDTTQGVPYWQLILGQSPPIALMKAKWNAAALTVPGVQSSTTYIASWTHRAVAGQIQITDVTGRVTAVPIQTFLPPGPLPSVPFIPPLVPPQPPPSAFVIPLPLSFTWDAPNPWGAARAISLWTHTDFRGSVGYFTLNSLTTYPITYDYPNPIPPRYAIDLKTFVNPGGQAGFVGKDIFFTNPGRGPVYDYPNPRGYVGTINLRTWTDPTKLQLLLQDTFFSGTGEGPVYDYPNPKGPPQGSISNKTFINPGGQALLNGTDVFFQGPGMGPDYDYPNPRGYVPSIALRTHIDFAKLYYLASMYGAPGQAPAYDWPNPRGKQPVALSFLFSTFNGISLVPQLNYDFPNPIPPSSTIV